MKKDDSHIKLPRRAKIAGSTDRGFGLVVGGIFLVLGCWPLLHGLSPRWYLAVPAALLVILGITSIGPDRKGGRRGLSFRHRIGFVTAQTSSLRRDAF